MPRPKSFDPDTALTKAMGVFWEKGFDAASISDLTHAMGINRFSLYDTFGDKHALYLKALDSYDQRVVEPILEKINSIQTIEDLESHFLCMIEYLGKNSDKPCCMMQKTAVAMTGRDQSVCDRVRSTRERMHHAFTDRFTTLISKGEVNKDLNPEDAAWVVMLTQAGLSSFSSSPIPQDQAKAAVRIMIKSLKSA